MQDQRIALGETLKVIKRLSPPREEIFTDHLKEAHLRLFSQDVRVVGNTEPGTNSKIWNAQVRGALHALMVVI